MENIAGKSIKIEIQQLRVEKNNSVNIMFFGIRQLNGNITKYFF